VVFTALLDPGVLQRFITEISTSFT